MPEITDSEFADATKRADAVRASRPTPVSVAFDRESGRLVVDFDNGSSFAVPARALQDLDSASEEELADVVLAGDDGLHWPRIDADFTISGLMRGVFGSRAFLESQRRGGQSRSEKKTAASRANGAKGGRPAAKRKA